MVTKKTTKKTEAPNIDLSSIGTEVETVVKKLSADQGLLEKFKTNAMAVVKKLLPAIKDTNILNAIIEAVSAKLNLGNLLGGLQGNAKQDGKEEKNGGILGTITGLFGGK